MKNKENIELIPKLRFLTFPIKNWDEKKLQDIFIYLSTNTYSRNLLNNKQGIYQNIHYGDILIKYGCIIDAQRDEIPYINKDVKCTTDNIIMDGDIVMADTAEDEIVGKTSEIFNIGDKKILSGLHTFWLRPLISFAPKYLGYFFNSTQYHNQLLPLIQGAKVSSISKKALNNTIIVYPSTSEQQKIADCLSSLDDLIEATAQKVDALKEHKKGLMQRLFPAEGKNVPDLRFPEFQASEKWKECILGNCLLEQPRYGINAPAVPFQKELPTYIRITDISEDGYFLPNPKVSVNHDAVDNFYLGIGDLVFARTGASVGKCYKYRKEDGKLVFAGFLIKVSPDQTRLSPDFLFQFTFSQLYWKWVDLTSTRSGQPGINSKEFASMMLYLPTKDEQQKIANCLFSLDELIEATSRKVEILKEHKKGLMQQLFPKI